MRQYARTEVEEFVFDEVALIDDRDFDRWLDLFTETARYIITSLDAHDRPQDEVLALAFDGRQRLEGRVDRLRSGHAHAEVPPSRTRHLVSNVRVIAQDSDRVVASAAFAVYRCRVTGTDLYVGRYDYELFKSDAGLRIAQRTATLDLYNLNDAGGVVSVLL